MLETIILLTHERKDIIIIIMVNGILKNKKNNIHKYLFIFFISDDS